LQVPHDPPPDEATLKAALARYLQYLIQRYQYLDLKGLGISERWPLRLPLLPLYIPQRVEAEPAATMEADSDRASGNFRERVLLLTLLKQHHGLIILGQPGLGKTTFLKYLALNLALGQGEALGLPNYLPLVLSLADYAVALAQDNISLRHFLPGYYRGRGLDLPLDSLIEAALNQGRALLLLDGLDQVSDLGLRKDLIDQVLAFYAVHRSAGNRLLITSRLIGYAPMRPLAEDLVECRLKPFTETDITLFVARWTQMIETISQETQAANGTLAQQEQAALLLTLARNPTVRQLATNPLLLTILAMMQRQGIVLPEKRVEVYQQYVDILLKHWHIARNLGRSPAPQLDSMDTLRILAALALKMVEDSPGLVAAGRRQINHYLIAVFSERGEADPPKAAAAFWAGVQNHASLLVEKGWDQFGFLHQSIQEYLIATAVADLGQQAITPVADKLIAHLEDDNWHEIILLTVGYVGLIQRRPEAAADLVTRLLQAETAVPGRALALVGEAAAAACPGGITAQSKEGVRGTLAAALENRSDIPAAERTLIGRSLGRLGEPHGALLSLAEMRLCYVAAGPFHMGNGTHAHLCRAVTHSFWLGRFPITNAQYAEFVTQGGYREVAYWPEAVAVERWREGQVLGWKRLGWRDRPADYGFPFNLPNHPVTGITFFEALAFTRWLTERWQAQGYLASGWTVLLPSEAEWELAARGGLHIPAVPYLTPITNLLTTRPVKLRTNPYPQRLFPWQNRERDPENEAEIEANFGNTGIKTTNRPGLFPRGAGPHGIEELSGNVWEWTRTQYAPYPYRIDDGREVTAVKLYQQMVLRGGAYWSQIRDIRCTARAKRSPNDCNSSYGFRILVKPPPEAD
jgi:formylglycine-generating enzyme required for sulfatase activity